MYGGALLAGTYVYVMIVGIGEQSALGVTRRTVNIPLPVSHSQHTHRINRKISRFTLFTAALNLFY